MFRKPQRRLDLGDRNTCSSHKSVKTACYHMRHTRSGVTEQLNHRKNVCTLLVRIWGGGQLGSHVARHEDPRTFERQYSQLHHIGSLE